jgi:tetratricopeptide (TPR) repeat protein
MAEGVGTVVALRRDAAAVPSARLAALALDAEQLLFFRLTALRELGRREDDGARAAVRTRLLDTHPEVVQIALAALPARPGAADAPALLRLLDHPVRTVRVEAAYALARMGWRGDGQARAALRADAEEMLVRHGRFTDLLVRAVAVTDALGGSGDTAPYLAEILRQNAAAAADGLHRRARWLTEEARHEEALRVYGEVKDLVGETDPERLATLYVDSADSLDASGSVREAAGNWDHAVRNFPPDGILFAVAEARLAALRGDREAAVRSLRALAARLEPEPWNAELLRRVRWSLRRIAGPGG